MTRYLLTATLAFFFSVGSVGVAQASGPRPCDIDGTPCTVPSDPPAEAPAPSAPATKAGAPCNNCVANVSYAHVASPDQPEATTSVAPTEEPSVTEVTSPETPEVSSTPTAAPASPVPQKNSSPWQGVLAFAAALGAAAAKLLQP